MSQNPIDPAQAALRRQLGQGFELLRQGRQQEAERLSAGLLASQPGHPEVLYLGSEVQLAGGRLEAALQLIEGAIAAAPGQLPLLLKQVNLLLLLRRRRQAREVMAAAQALAGADPQALWSVGTLYSRGDDPRSARALYERARAGGCNDPGLLYALATSCLYVGDFEAAESTVETLLGLLPRHGLALHLRASLRRQTAASNHVADLQARLAAGFPNDGARAAALYALAKELEDLGQADASFAALSAGATLKRRTLQYDAAAELAAIESIRSAYSAEVMQAATAGFEQEGPIFIVGMPRTGTTLVERMLGRHREVSSAGELLDFSNVLADAVNRQLERQPGLTPVAASLQLDFAALGRDYYMGASEAAPDTRLFIDKMPINFMYCGLIRKALPRARLIHLVRDPMDSCYAIYKTLFNQAYHFSYDLAELADYYATYHRLMQHWHQVMPGAILDVRYEDLVTDTEAQARRLLDWCGLDWQPEVLAPDANAAPSTTASAAQVREPVHAGSVAKWRRYAAGLAPLQARLAAAGVIEG